jgi:hypothetical protein
MLLVTIAFMSCLLCRLMVFIGKGRRWEFNSEKDCPKAHKMIGLGPVLSLKMMLNRFTHLSTQGLTKYKTDSAQKKYN